MVIRHFSDPLQPLNLSGGVKSLPTAAIFTREALYHLLIFFVYSVLGCGVGLVAGMEGELVQDFLCTQHCCRHSDQVCNCLATSRALS